MKFKRQTYTLACISKVKWKWKPAPKQTWPSSWSWALTLFPVAVFQLLRLILLTVSCPPHPRMSVPPVRDVSVPYILWHPEQCSGNLTSIVGLWIHSSSLKPSSSPKVIQPGLGKQKGLCGDLLVPGLFILASGSVSVHLKPNNPYKRAASSAYLSPGGKACFCFVIRPLPPEHMCSLKIRTLKLYAAVWPIIRRWGLWEAADWRRS